VNCVICNKPFKTYPSKVKLNRGKYCSKKCSDKMTLIKKGQHLSRSTEFKKGQPNKFYGHISYQIPRKNGNKYKLVYKPNHPRRDHRGYVREHRLVMEESIGRYLLPSEVVHHIDGNTLNNSLDNLELLDKREHDKRNTKLNVHKRWQR
jgi:hypothetical protein